MANFVCRYGLSAVDGRQNWQGIHTTNMQCKMLNLMRNELLHIATRSPHERREES